MAQHGQLRLAAARAGVGQACAGWAARLQARHADAVGHPARVDARAVHPAGQRHRRKGGERAAEGGGAALRLELSNEPALPASLHGAPVVVAADEVDCVEPVARRRARRCRQARCRCGRGRRGRRPRRVRARSAARLRAVRHARRRGRAVVGSRASAPTARPSRPALAAQPAGRRRTRAAVRPAGRARHHGHEPAVRTAAAARPRPSRPIAPRANHRIGP